MERGVLVRGVKIIVERMVGIVKGTIREMIILTKLAMITMKKRMFAVLSYSREHQRIL